MKTILRVITVFLAIGAIIQTLGFANSDTKAQKDAPTKDNGGSGGPKISTKGEPGI